MSSESAVSEHRYGDRDDQVLSLYAAAGAAPSDATVVAVHGGAWRTGDRALMHTTAAGLSQRGLAVASVEYRQRPADPVADMLADLRDAMRWVVERAEGGRVVLLGDSAGAHAGLLYALRAAVAGAGDGPIHDAPVPDAVVSLCGALSLGALLEPADDDQRRRFPEYVATIIGDSDAARLRDHDPVAARRGVEGRVPPLFASTSNRDFFQSSTRAYIALAQKLGDDVTVHELGHDHDACGHSWQLDAELAETQQLLDLVRAWIGSVPQ